MLNLRSDGLIQTIITKLAKLFWILKIDYVETGWIEIESNNCERWAFRKKEQVCTSRSMGGTTDKVLRNALHNYIWFHRKKPRAHSTHIGV